MPSGRSVPNRSTIAIRTSGPGSAQLAARMPLIEVAAAMWLAESGPVTGKVILVP